MKTSVSFFRIALLFVFLSLIMTFVLQAYAKYCDIYPDKNFKLIYRWDIVANSNFVNKNNSGEVLIHSGRTYDVSVYMLNKDRILSVEECWLFATERDSILIGYDGFSFLNKEVADIITKDRSVKEIMSFEDKPLSLIERLMAPALCRGGEDFGQDPDVFYSCRIGGSCWKYGTAILCIREK